MPTPIDEPAADQSCAKLLVMVCAWCAPSPDAAAASPPHTSHTICPAHREPLETDAGTTAARDLAGILVAVSSRPAARWRGLTSASEVQAAVRGALASPALRVELARCYPVPEVRAVKLRTFLAAFEVGRDEIEALIAELERIAGEDRRQRQALQTEGALRAIGDWAWERRDVLGDHA